MKIPLYKTVLGFGAVGCAALGLMIVLKLPVPEAEAAIPAAPVVEDADFVKASIGKSFATAPGLFNLPAASTRLANARLEGYAVCDQSTEATAAQYIEVSEMLDKVSKSVAEFQRAVDGVMDSKAGMSDCDFRVISAMSKAAAGA